MKKIIFISFLFFLVACKQDKKAAPSVKENLSPIKYAQGFSLERMESGVTILKITSPWSNTETSFTYALVPKNNSDTSTINKEDYDAIIQVPVEHLVVTSTTHIPALEALGVENRLIAFPDTKYISSKKTRALIDAGKVKELGHNEVINTEMVIELQPDLVIGFSINNQNKHYQTIQKSGIPIVYNGDWTEKTPLGKAEWIKFFAPFFQKEQLANTIFNDVEKSYSEAKLLAKTALKKPTVFSGALYKDVWYTPGGKSWAALFFEDANANYIWKNTQENGSLALSWESVLDQGKHTEFWIGPAQFTTYEELEKASKHYIQFDAFKNKKIFTYAKTKSTTGGLLYYELAPHRPDIVLKDLIHILHPELLTNYKPFFFKPLD